MPLRSTRSASFGLCKPHLASLRADRRRELRNALLAQLRAAKIADVRERLVLPAPRALPSSVLHSPSVPPRATRGLESVRRRGEAESSGNRKGQPGLAWCDSTAANTRGPGGRARDTPTWRPRRALYKILRQGHAPAPARAFIDLAHARVSRTGARAPVTPREGTLGTMCPAPSPSGPEPTPQRGHPELQLRGPIHFRVFREGGLWEWKRESRGEPTSSCTCARARARLCPPRPPCRTGAAPPDGAPRSDVVMRHCTRNECTACNCAPIAARPADRCADRPRWMPPRPLVRSVSRTREAISLSSYFLRGVINPGNG